MRQSQFIKYWLPVVIYAILIFCVSAVPGRNIPNLFSGQDIFFHIIEYAIFALLINRALRASYPDMFYAQRIVLVFLLSFIYAISDEFHQLFIPGRCASFVDLFNDGLGSWLGSLFYRWQR